MIIALVNQEDQTITICHKTVEVISIFDVDRIANLLMGKQVYYITAAEEANGDDDDGCVVAGKPGVVSGLQGGKGRKVW